MARESRIFLETSIDPNLLWKSRQNRSGSHPWYKRLWKNRLFTRTKVLPVEIHQKISLLKLKLHLRKIPVIKAWSQIALRLNRRLLIQSRKNRVMLSRNSHRVHRKLICQHKMLRFSRTSSILCDILVETNPFWLVRKLRQKLVLKKHQNGLAIWTASIKPSQIFRPSNRVINRDQKRSLSGLTSLFNLGPKLSPNFRRTKKMRKKL